jgi:heme/copper-type cytochrome/quinol oxidase subunit 3
VTTAANPYALPVNPATRRNPGWWAMLLIVITEGMLFMYLLFAYFYLGSMSNAPWPPSGPPDLKLVAPNTIILLVSSGTMWWAESGIRAGSQLRLRLGLVITLLLGALFLVIQGIEYSKKDFALQSNAYGSLFFTITGFHGAHVFVGLLFNIVVQIRAWLGHFTVERHLAVSNAAIYWHFVDAVWLVVFASLYLAPHLT